MWLRYVSKAGEKEKLMSSVVAVNDELGSVGNEEQVERVVPREEVKVEEEERERGSMEPLRFLASAETRLEEIVNPMQMASIPVVTGHNLQLVKKLCKDLESFNEEVLDEYPCKF